MRRVDLSTSLQFLDIGRLYIVGCPLVQEVRDTPVGRTVNNVFRRSTAGAVLLASGIPGLTNFSPEIPGSVKLFWD